MKNQNLLTCSLSVLGLVLLGSFCKGTSSKNGEGRGEPIGWEESRVEAHIATIAAAPHFTGSPRQKEVAAYIEAEAKALGLEVSLDPFTATVPDPAATSGAASVMQTLTLDLPAQNILAKLKVPGSSCVVMLASHYDSKRLEGEISLGANDSGSSSAALLEIMRGLGANGVKEQLKCSVLAVWFDAEEAYLPDWDTGERKHPAKIKDHLYGSRHMAESLSACEGGMCLPSASGGERIKAFFLLDMIGMPNVSLTRESNSHPELLEKAVALDKTLHDGFLYRSRHRFPVEDDHIPFAARGVRVLDLIDFHNTDTWHTAQDVPASLSMSSIRKVGMLAAALVLDEAKEP